jgi:hypothetical protein
MNQLLSNLKQNRLLQLFTISLRYLIGSAFVFASIVKIEGKRFTSNSGADYPINSSWHYFETMYQSGIYWNFIGWGQFIAGLLLMTQVFSTLGAVAFFPIILNVFMVTISYQFEGTIFITSLMLLATIYLLIWDWNKLRFIALPNQSNYIDDNHEFSKRRVWVYLGIFLFLMTILMQKAAIQNNLANYLGIINTTFSAIFMLSCVIIIFLTWLITVIIQWRKS